VATTLPNGNVGAPSVAPQHTSTATYTSDGLLLESSAPGLTGTDKNVTRYTYDAVGNPTTVMSPNETFSGGRALHYTYTQDNLIYSSTDPKDVTSYQTSYYDYTASGQKASVQTGVCISSDQSLCDRRALLNSGGSIRFTYAPNGLSVDQVGRNGQSITTGYDRVGRPTTVTDPTSGITITANYYLDGLLRSTNDGSVTSAYAYDAAGAVTMRGDQINASGITGGLALRTQYLYNDAGLPSKMQFPLEGIRNYTYDQAGRELSNSHVGGRMNYVETNTWNPDNSLASTGAVTDGNNSTTQSYQYRYDSNGSIVVKKLTGGGQSSTRSFTDTFGYNPAQNVTSFSHQTSAGTASTTYDWDRNGNRTGLTYTPSGGAAQTASWVYRDNNSLASHTISGVGTRTVTQDPVGRTTTDACATYTYDGFDRTASTRQRTLQGCQTGWAAGSTTTYSYDGLDRQRSSAVTGSSTAAANDTTRSAYDGLSDRLIGQVDAQNASHDDPNTYYFLDPWGQQVGKDQTNMGWLSWLTDDGFGSIVQESGYPQPLRCSVAYDPFGNPIDPAAGGNGMCATNNMNTANALWYRGYTRDAAAGSYQLGTRTYQPGIAGFTTPDTYRVGTPATDLSVGTDPLTANTYTYVNGNPVNAWDPSGHRSWDFKQWFGKKVADATVATGKGISKAAGVVVDTAKTAWANRPRSKFDLDRMRTDLLAGSIFSLATTGDLLLNSPRIDPYVPKDKEGNPVPIVSNAVKEQMQNVGIDTDSYTFTAGRVVGEVAQIVATGGAGAPSAFVRTSQRLVSAAAKTTKITTDAGASVLVRLKSVPARGKPSGVATDARVPVASTGGTPAGTVRVGGGATFDNISAAEAARIQNAADRVGHQISLVGSRARGDAGAYSDWDYVVPGISSRTRHSLKSSLPRAPTEVGTDRRIDIFTGPLDQRKPYITFSPRG